MCERAYVCARMCVCVRLKARPPHPPSKALRLMPEAQGQPLHPSPHLLPASVSPSPGGAVRRKPRSAASWAPSPPEAEGTVAKWIWGIVYAGPTAEPCGGFIFSGHLSSFLKPRVAYRKSHTGLRGLLVPWLSKPHGLELSPARSLRPRGRSGPGSGSAVPQPLRESAVTGPGIREGSGDACWVAEAWQWGEKACEGNLFTRRTLGTHYPGGGAALAAQRHTRKPHVGGSLSICWGHFWTARHSGSAVL